MGVADEILDAIEIVTDKKLRDVSTAILQGVCKSVKINSCVMSINGKDNTVQYYGGTPIVGNVYRVFVPSGNMSMAFIIIPGAGGSASSDVTSVNGKTGDVILTASDVGALSDTTVIPTKTSELTNDSGYITEANVPTKTSELDNDSGYITASGAPVQSVNGKTGAVNLGAGDVGALPSTTKIPSSTSDLTNDSGYITSADVPVKSVNGKTGAVSLTAADVNALPSSTKIPTKTSDITNDSGYITEADVPTKTSELTNDSGFITSAALDPYAKSTDIPTKVSELDNDSGFVNATQAKNASPVQSVDGATGAVVTNAVKTINQTLTDAQKTQARTNIGAVTSNDVNAYEAKLRWGGANIAGDVAPVDAATFPIIGYNKAEFSNPDGVTVEYSTDGGATWLDYGSSAYQKALLLSENLGTHLIVGKGAAASVDNKLRITVNANTCGFYTKLKKVLIEISSGGAQGCSVLIEQAKGSSPGTFSTIGTYPISGQSGWNSIDVAKGSNFYFGGANNQTSHWWIMRFTFSIGGLATSGDSKLTVLKLLFFGTTSWITPSNMAKTGHLYSYDYAQNAEFPQRVKAKTFDGDASNTTVAFTEATTRANITTGEKLSAMFGKIAKWFADLGALAFKSVAQKTDLADDVQASLSKADSALQSAPVTSVNSQTGDVQLSAADVGALPSTTKIPSKTSDITNDSGFITAADVPTKVSELDNDAGYITDAALTSYAKVADIPTKTSQLTNDSDFATTAQVNAKYTKPTSGIPKTDLAAGVQASLDKADTALQSAPVTSVNGKTGVVLLDASDVGAVSTDNVTTTLGTSATKVPSEKAVSDALSSAGAGDMLKSAYDPDNSVATAGGIPDYVDSQLPAVNDATLTIQRNGTEIGTFTANASANKSINITVPTSKGDVGLGNVDNVKQYSASNPPPYPVTSVNGQTGAVTVEVDLPDGLVKYTPVSSVQSVDALDADTLQGHNAAYFATSAGLSAVDAKVITNTNDIDTLSRSLSANNDKITTLQNNKVDKSGGAMSGALIAQTNTNYTTRQVRNVIISTADPSGGQNGDIWIRYQA